MISCLKSTEWIIKKEQGALSLKGNVQLQAHLAICRACSLFEHQSQYINKAFGASNATQDSLLNVTEKENLLRSIKEK